MLQYQSQHALANSTGFAVPHPPANCSACAALGVPMPVQYVLSGSLCLPQTIDFRPKLAHRTKKDRHAFRPVKMHTKRMSCLPQMIPSAIENHSGGLLRDALRESRLEKSSRCFPKASWGRFGRLRDIPGAPREAPGELWSPPGYVPGAARIVLLHPKAPQSDFDSILAQFWLDLSSI